MSKTRPDVKASMDVEDDGSRFSNVEDDEDNKFREAWKTSRN
uniref:Uncharacterized protein n=1 Tax=Cucumis melo TaxID=3656 RepID=A0A9I9EGS2_CUCME